VPYHVRITSRDPLRRHHDALAFDKEADWIEEHIAAPRREGRDIFVDGQVFSWDGIDMIRITETDQTSEQLLPQIRARRQRHQVVTAIPDRWYVASDAGMSPSGSSPARQEPAPAQMRARPPPSLVTVRQSWSSTATT
jgi:hypothetical protein